jgi:hypothetical protein
MTRWLQAAKQTTEADTEPAHDTRPDASGAPASGVSSVMSVLPEGNRADPEPARADGLDPDPGAYLDRLRLHGPATYGTMAAALGWGVTRAWQAEAKLRAAGLVLLGELGRAVPTERGQL